MVILFSFCVAQFPSDVSADFLFAHAFIAVSTPYVNSAILKIYIDVGIISPFFWVFPDSSLVYSFYSKFTCVYIRKICFHFDLIKHFNNYSYNCELLC